MELLYNVPAAVLLFLALAVALGLALGAQLFIHRRFKSADFVAHNELGGIIIVVTASIYAVLLGFLTVVAWEHFQAAREIVVLESGANIDAWHTAVGLPPEVRTRVRSDMAAYAQDMVDQEWGLMRRGRFDPKAAMLGMDAMDATGAMLPANAGQSNAQTATMQQLGILHDARQRRIAMNESGVTWFEWLVLLIGALSIISFCWLFGGSRQSIHLVMTSTVVVMIVSTLVLLFELQYPFRSNIAVSSKPWSEAIAHLHQMQTGAMMDMRM
jgi:hypothetical protein